MLGHFALSQDYLLKCWDTSYCPRTHHSSAGTLHTVPRPPVQVLGHLALSHDLPLKCWDTSHCPQTSHSSVGTLRTVPRLPAQVLGHFVLFQGPFVLVLGHFALSQDLFVQKLGHLELSQNLPLKCWDTSHCPKTSHSSVGSLRTVPRLPAQVLGHFVLSQDLSS